MDMYSNKLIKIDTGKINTFPFSITKELEAKIKIDGLWQAHGAAILPYTYE